MVLTRQTLRCAAHVVRNRTSGIFTRSRDLCGRDQTREDSTLMMRCRCRCRSRSAGAILGGIRVGKIRLHRMEIDLHGDEANAALQMRMRFENRASKIFIPSRDLCGRDQTREHSTKSHDDDAHLFACSMLTRKTQPIARSVRAGSNEGRLDPLIRIVETREHMTWQNIRRRDADADAAAQARSWAGSESGGFY